MSRTRRTCLALIAFVIVGAVAFPLARLALDAYTNMWENVEAHRTYVLSTKRDGGGKGSDTYHVKFRMENGAVKNMRFNTGPGAEAGEYWTVYTYNKKSDPDTLHYWMRDPTYFAPSVPYYIAFAAGAVGFLMTLTLTSSAPTYGSRRYAYA